MAQNQRARDSRSRREKNNASQASERINCIVRCPSREGPGRPGLCMRAPLFNTNHSKLRRLALFGRRAAAGPAVVSPRPLKSGAANRGARGTGSRISTCHPRSAARLQIGCTSCACLHVWDGHDLFHVLHNTFLGQRRVSLSSK